VKNGSGTACTIIPARRLILSAAILGGFVFNIEAARAENLLSALARAYVGNPDLNQNRASVRAQDEEAPKALSGLRPKASIQATAGFQTSTMKILSGRWEAIESYRDFSAIVEELEQKIWNVFFDTGTRSLAGMEISLLSSPAVFARLAPV
jgi:hypothetical protein